MTLGSDNIKQTNDESTKANAKDKPHLQNNVANNGNNNTDNKSVKSLKSMKSLTSIGDGNDPKVIITKNDEGRVSDCDEANERASPTERDDSKSLVANGDALSRGVSFEDDACSEIVRIESQAEEENRPASKFGNLVRTIQVGTVDVGVTGVTSKVARRQI